MAVKNSRRRKAIIRRRIFLSLCALVLATVIALISFFVYSITKDDGGKNSPADSSTTSSAD